MTRITRKSRISHKNLNIFCWTLMVLLLLARVGIIPLVERVLHLLTRVGITPLEPACGFQTYRSPLHFEGLPQLIEVFATDDSVYFTVLNQGVCEPEWGDGAQMFAPKEKDNVRFACEFPDEETTLVVPSDPVPPTDGTLWTEAISVLRCALPFKLQGSVTSSRTVNLRATVNLEEGREIDPSWKHGSSKELGVYKDLPLCPREWPTNSVPEEGRQKYNRKETVFKNKGAKRLLSMVTQIVMEYETFEKENRIRVQIDPIQVISWLEYNLLIGFEHFYIFDNDPKEHGPLERLLVPYVQAGLVTYVWYPLRDCIRKSTDELNGSRMTISQALSSTSALRRYEHQTTFMGHFDIDEYIQLPPGEDDIRNILRSMPTNSSTLFHPQSWYHDCDLSASEMGAHKMRSLSPASPDLGLDETLCVSSDSTPGKSIMRTSEILAFFVHTPWVKTDHSLFNWDAEVTQREGLFIAHMRQRRARDGIPIKSIDERFLVPNIDQRTQLQASISRRMIDFHTPQEQTTPT